MSRLPLLLLSALLLICFSDARPAEADNGEQVLSQSDATADADNESQANSLSEAGTGSLSKSGSKADNKGLSNAAARAFNNSSANALGKSDGQGKRAPKAGGVQTPVPPQQPSAPAV